jgi:hypothetical protein
MGLLIQQLNKQSASIGGGLTGAQTQEDYNALAGVRTPFAGISTPNITGGVISTGGASTTTTATGSKITTNVKPAPTLIEQVSEEQFLKRTVGTGNQNVAAFRAAENAGITINVNAPSVIDETGFTRAVQLAIQNTQQRGTGGIGFALIQ